MKKGIDVSKHNGTIDWEKAKSGLDFAMLRIGFGGDISSQDDVQFNRNVSECERLGIPWGGYLYSYALNTSQAQSEAKHAIRLLKGKTPTYPIFIDMEDADGYKAKHGGIPSRSTNTAIVKTFCEALKAEGYKTGYYCNKDWYKNRLNPSELDYDFWFARPGVSSPDIACDIWQDEFPETGGRWPGANTSAGCDTDIAYTNYTKQSVVYAPDGAPYVSDTTMTLQLPKGNKYQLEVQCDAGRPNVVAGTGSVVDVSFGSQNGTKYYFILKGNGNVGQSSGIYINGDLCFNTNIISSVKSDTTQGIKMQKGDAYTVLLTSSVKPSASLSDNGVATIAGVFQNGTKTNEWLVPIVCYGAGNTVFQTQVPGEPVTKWFTIEG